MLAASARILIGHALPLGGFSHGGSYTDETATTATLNKQLILDTSTKFA
jgi:hypothetical protein